MFVFFFSTTFVDYYYIEAIHIAERETFYDSGGLKSIHACAYMHEQLDSVCLYLHRARYTC